MRVAVMALLYCLKRKTLLSTARTLHNCTFHWVSLQMILSLLTFGVAFMPSALKVILHFLVVTNSFGSRIENGPHFSWSNETTSERNATLQEWITGTYTYSSSDNFESYLKGLGVSYFLRKLALLASPVVSIRHSQVFFHHYWIPLLLTLYCIDKTNSIIMAIMRVTWIPDYM